MDSRAPLRALREDADNAGPDLPGEIEFIETPDIRFETLVAQGGDKLALLLHGFPESHYSWRQQIPLLVEHGYTVWAPNLRGYGHTTRPKGIDAYHIDRLVEDVAHLIDAAVDRGLGLPLLMAHDWGGMIAWMALIRDIRAFERFVVMNLPHPALFMKAMRENKRQRQRSWYMRFFQLPWLPEKVMTWNDAAAVRRAFYGMAVDKSRFPRAVLDHYADNAQLPGAMTAMINYYRAVPRAQNLSAEVMAADKVKVPTLMIWGEEDTALGVELTEGTENYVEDLCLRRIPYASHWVQQDAPEIVNKMIDAWLSDEPVPRA